MFAWSIKLFRIFGIRLELHFTFFLLPAIFAVQGYQNAGTVGALWNVALVVVAFTCVVMHELGHSLTARKFDIRTERILLMPIGGMAQFLNLPATPKQEILITFAGPLVNFAIAALLFPFTGLSMPVAFPTTLEQLLLTTTVFNLAMGIFNLIPVFPMDGGRILRAVLSFWLQPLKATRFASKLGTFLATALAIYIVIGAERPNDYLLAALFLFISYASRMEYRGAKRNHLLAGLKVGDFIDPDFLSLPLDATVGDAFTLLASRPDGDILVLDGSTVVGALCRSDLKNSKAKLRLSSPIESLLKTSLPMIQSHAPIDFLFNHPLSKGQNTVPIYRYIDFIGAVHKDAIEEQAEWIQKRHALSQS